jgi:spore coat polysaccharide biosynthesis protein SpsF (cytidylyltransferase family)
MLADINGKSMLQWVVDRTRQSKVDEVVVATTPSSQPIIDYCCQHGINYYAGDEEDILSRLYGVATQYKADVIIRVWGDSPLINPHCINLLLIAYQLAHSPDYVYRDDGHKGTGAARLTFRKLEHDYKTLKGEDRHWYHKYCWPDLSVDDEKSLQLVRSILV